MRLFLLISIVSSACFGWGDLGHSSVAEIAERNLTDKARAMVFGVIGAEPLAVSAVFPDQVRSDERFKAFSPYHFFEIPEGANPATVAQSDAAAKKKTAETLISLVPRFLTRKAPTNEKAVLLRYLVHVVGDVHMPLHIGNGVDMGANLCTVEWLEPATGLKKKSNLHTVWDENIFEYAREDFLKQNSVSPGLKRYFGYPAIVAMALEEYNRQVANGEVDPKIVAVDNPLAWYAESRSYHPQIYPDEKPVRPEERKYCKQVDPTTKKVVDGVYDPSAVPLLGEAYARKSLKLILRQIVVGGLRLAKLLNDTAEKVGNLKPAPKAFENLLESIQLEKNQISGEKVRS